jgi:hypothetical protein
MVMIVKNGMITLKEAIQSFIGSTISYIALLYHRELYSIASGKAFNEFTTIKSYRALVLIATIIYLGTLLAWFQLVLRSYRNWKSNQARVD